MKKRKFAVGGDVPYMPNPGSPVLPPDPGFPTPITPPGRRNMGGGDNTAYGGLAQVGAGAKTVGSALDDISDRLGGGIKGVAGAPSPGMTMKKGGKVKGYAKGGVVGSASKRADGVAQRGKTRGRFISGAC
jgi:hypothetical protein